MAALSASAGAQGYYPPPPPTPYNQGYNQQGSALGQVINQVLGGGRYGTYGQGNDRMAVDQCARAAEVRVSQDNRRGVYGAWNQGYANQGNGNQGYNQYYGRAQVVGITGVERRQNGLKVSGLLRHPHGPGQLWPVQPERPGLSGLSQTELLPEPGLPEPGLRPAGLWQPGL